MVQQELGLMMRVMVRGRFMLRFMRKRFDGGLMKKREFLYKVVNVCLFWYIVGVVGMIFRVMG